jgi:micrococcal nuclease
MVCIILATLLSSVGVGIAKIEDVGIAGIEHRTVKCHVSKVIDGDTIDATMPDGSAERIRLLGIDTPEIFKENRPNEYDAITDLSWLDVWGEKAKEYTERMVEGKDVFLEVDEMAGDRGKYGRLLRYVILEDGSDLNALLLNNGYARAYTEGKFSNFTKRDEYTDLQHIAQKDRVGLWAKMKDSSLLV